ncbi:unnamed protein product, partial [Ectocarpus sp. 4 AP-2014]
SGDQTAAARRAPLAAVPAPPVGARRLGGVLSALATTPRRHCPASTGGGFVLLRGGGDNTAGRGDRRLRAAAAVRPSRAVAEQQRHKSLEQLGRRGIGRGTSATRRSRRGSSCSGGRRRRRRRDADAGRSRDYR